MSDIEKDIPELEYCSLKQALDWICFDLKPIAERHERLIRVENHVYSNTEQNKNNFFLIPFLTGKLTVYASKGVLKRNEAFEDMFFVKKEEEERLDLKNIQFDYVDWDNGYMYKYGDFDNVYGNIKIPFKELKELFPRANDNIVSDNKERYLDHFELVYEDNVIYLQVNNNNRFELKKLKQGDTKSIFEYIYKNPKKLLTDNEIITNAKIKKWDIKVDRIDQRIRNIFSDKSIIKNCFPIIGTHEIKFIKTFILPAQSNAIPF